ncbi:putative ribosomal-protein-alanine acetyltransferase [Paenibacillus sp. CCS19]|uniref:GNAT family N-acetyltransferase n=1 Tax=Paenibacillus sp. CCS19 TaxID=3158387 RepID=UPI00255FAD5E|nr:GNAT family N-acetyltransferase [Paenibacillus cellulosilyticus]GMK37390.1 putative ribosomal-protein-alanine acetyltransferase [Paenibacillus cellulosilyticus]
MKDQIIELRHFTMEDAAELLAYKIRNRAFLQPFEPIRNELHYTLEGTRLELASDEQNQISGLCAIFGVFIKESRELVGRAALTGIAGGAFLNAYLGYAIDQAHNGKGFATIAVNHCVRYAFEQLGLHRVQAGVMPHNKASLRVLENAGFREEGLAKHYLRINGRWEDHVLLAITQEDVRVRNDGQP